MIALRVIPMKVRVDDVANRLGGNLPLHLANQTSSGRWLGVRVDHHHVFRSDEDGGIAINLGLGTGEREVNAVSNLLNIE